MNAPEQTLVMRRALIRLSHARISRSASIERVISPPETITVSKGPSVSGVAESFTP
jgi:hypothetical protein